MPKLRRLSGKQIIKIFEHFGFDVDRIRGSHHTLKRVVDGHSQSITVPVHGNKALPAGTIKGIYRQGLNYIPEDELILHFYA